MPEALRPTLDGMPTPVPISAPETNPFFNVKSHAEARASFTLNLLDLILGHENEWIEAIAQHGKYGTTEVLNQFIYECLAATFETFTHDAPGLTWTWEDDIEADSYRITAEQETQLFEVLRARGVPLTTAELD